MKNRIFILFTLLFSLSLGLNAQNLTEYAKRKSQEVQQKALMEKQRYEEAVEKGTRDALKTYIQYYPKGKYSADVKNRLADFTLWDAATAKNTREAYEQYLTKSRYRYFAKEAQAAITQIAAGEEWNRVLSAPTIELIDKFLSRYPSSPERKEAERLRYELKGAQLYAAGDFERAYQAFNEAGGRAKIAEKYRSAYNRCADEHDFARLKMSSKREDYFAFLRDHPSSPHRDEVSNRVAVSLANDFDRTVNEFQRDMALGYARDEQTKNYVRQAYFRNRLAQTAYVAQQEKDKKEAEKRYKRSRRRDNGRPVQFGLEISDLAFSVGQDTYQPIGEWNFGLGIKFGNYRTPVQLEIGIKPGMMIMGGEYEPVYDLYYGKYSPIDYYYDRYDYSEEALIRFHMPLYAKVKLNLFNLGEGKLYVGATGFFNAVRPDDFTESRYAWSTGLGWAWKRWDWTILYYKRDIGDLENQKIGFALSCYF